MRNIRNIVLAATVSFASAVQAAPDGIALPASQGGIGQFEQVAEFYGPMPTGVTVSRTGRIFVNFPRWGDKVPYTVVELKGGQAMAYPNAATNDFGREGLRSAIATENTGGARAMREGRFVSVQSVVVDARDRLWVLDTGSIAFGKTAYGGPKLVGIDLKTNKIWKKIVFPTTVALPTTYLNDVRFDLRRGTDGMAFITDSGGSGPNGIIVVDLGSGRSWRRLNGHKTVKAEQKFVPMVEGKAVMMRKPGTNPKHMKIGADGIAISPDGKRLYYCPLSSRRLYSVSIDALTNLQMSDAQVAATIIDHGDKGVADGLESDAQGRVYITNPEHNAITRRLPNGLFETIVRDDRILWPDTLSLAGNGYLYFTANQLHRQASYNWGRDLRQKPYSLFRVKVNGTPIRR